MVILKDLSATIPTRHTDSGEQLNARRSLVPHVLLQQLHRQMTRGVSQMLDVMRSVSQRPDTLPHFGLQTHPPDHPLPFFYFIFFLICHLYHSCFSHSCDFIVCYGYLLL